MNAFAVGETSMLEIQHFNLQKHTYQHKHQHKHKQYQKHWTNTNLNANTNTDTTTIYSAYRPLPIKHYDTQN